MCYQLQTTWQSWLHLSNWAPPTSQSFCLVHSPVSTTAMLLAQHSLLGQIQIQLLPKSRFTSLSLNTLCLPPSPRAPKTLSIMNHFTFFPNFFQYLILLPSTICKTPHKWRQLQILHIEFWTTKQDWIQWKYSTNTGQFIHGRLCWRYWFLHKWDGRENIKIATSWMKFTFKFCIIISTGLANPLLSFFFLLVTSFFHQSQLIPLPLLKPWRYVYHEQRML